MNKKLQAWINKILNDFGYISIKTYDRDMQTQKFAWQQREKKLEEQKIDILVQSIRTVNMVKTRLVTPFNSFIETDGDNISKEIPYETIYPPKSNWYKFQFILDAAKLQRVYQELEMSQNSYEYEYLKRSILHDIETNIDALMKVGILQ